MSKRTAKALPAVDDDLDDGPVGAVSPDDDDLWDDEMGDTELGDDEDLDADADEPTDLEGRLDKALEEATHVAIADEFSAFVCATLPAKMKRRRLADQSSEWLLATIGRVVDELLAQDGKDDEAIVDLELDLLKLGAHAKTRGIAETIPAYQSELLLDVAARVETEGARDDVAALSDAAPMSNPTNLQIEYIPRDHIQPDPSQPRAHADAELKESIRASGILQPITVRRLLGVRGGYIIVDGERRWQGAADVLDVMPCIVRDDQEDEYTRLKTQLVANTGKALSPIEEARAFARMLDANSVGVAALARDLGRPPSTVNDRLKLLELGPWLPLIDNGTVSLSMAVEHLVPLRGVPDEFHAEAIAKMVDGLRPGEPIAENVEDFGRSVASEYDRFMYPITKSKNQYEKQPLFNTKAHDAECSCGGISWGGSWQGVVTKGRKFCGNPDWWKPLHAAAKKAERAKAKESGDTAPAKKGQLRIELPAGTKTVSVGYGQVPKDILELTDNYEGRWSVTRWINGDLEDAFDPADLEIDDAKLVRIKPSYGLDRVGTRDAAAVKAARAKFAARFAPVLEKTGKKLVADFAKLAHLYDVGGAGVHVLLGNIDVSDREFAEAADLLSIDVPDAVRKSPHQNKTQAALDWFGKSLKRADAEKLLSFFVYMFSSKKHELPSAIVRKEMRTAVEEIQRKRAPWATTRAPKPAAKKKVAK